MHPLVRWLPVAVALVVALVFTTVGLANLNALRKVVFTRVTAPGRVQPGVVEVLARVRTAREPLTAPLSGEPCVGYVLREEDRGGGLRSLWGRRWRTTDRESAFHPFYLADGTGRVRVEPAPDGREESVPWPGNPPDDFFTDLELTPDEQRVVAAGESLPEHLGGDAAPEARRYTEWRIDPDDGLYVLGRARESDDPEEPPVLENDGRPFVVSELPQWRIALRRLLRALAFLVVAAGLLVGAAIRAGVA